METEIMIETNLIPSSPHTNQVVDVLNNNENSISSSNNNNNKELKGESGYWSHDVLSIIYTLSNWLRGIEEKHFDPEEYKEKEKELWKEWEWVLSTTEEFVLKQNQQESEKVLGELNNLKKTASNLKVKPYFINQASELLKIQTDLHLDTLKSPLDSNKRSAVISTVINTMESQWLNYIKERFFYDEEEAKEPVEDGWVESSGSDSKSISNTFLSEISEVQEIKQNLKLNNTSFEDIIILNKNINKITWIQFLDSFKGQKYSKGITARMKDIGFQASHGLDGSLNARVLGDITWSIWNALNTALKQIRELTQEESRELVENVSLLQPVLLKLWLNTKINSKIGVKNEGLVVEKWKKDELSKKKKILDLKRSGKLDKYTGEKTIVMAHERREISSLRSTLEQKLKLRPNN
ncbi:hypothetical protein PPL_09019 [Heterostelium album PN500]|uniref:Uncharacterized protein n=1 Tax=Heterostelium pallidum (strain ATCC 26659 / Pp 5 / PN500) TaxID=670386 RepID=D3BKD8_HETP5|nr:hypothetical protein PPL_09019 [Heterostelium album PN500]EFA78368.1 hypothetical protein PPL_09019 [Heterostelium album PN500]|eukprot:XP_020430493.1 hypothetical protein PPL_09019 [Heterostelium album PN500]